MLEMSRARFHTLRFAALACLLGMLPMVAGCASGAAMVSQLTPTAPDPYAITMRYVEHFYPRWFFYEQGRIATYNQLIGPDRMDPVYGAVVAPNDDTLYSSTYVDTRTQPVILRVPSTSVTYSLLTIDLYGDVFASGVTGPGTYAITPPGWTGTLPAGATQIKAPNPVTVWIFRADKFSSTGVDQSAQAELFREQLHLQSLSDYQSNPSGGTTNIIPVADFGFRFKVAADDLMQRDGITFLKQLQQAVKDSATPTLSPWEQQLSNSFDSYFADSSNASIMSSAVLAEHNAIVQFYTSHTGPTKWIGFTDLGYSSGYSSDLERDAIAEYIQCANGHSTSQYYQTFEDSTGAALDGSAAPNGYALTFPANNLPQAKRFWSITAYTPDSITLISNPANVYLVASYTPGLVTNPDGSVTIYLAQTQPAGAPTANWLPVPNGPFNIMLRDYGPLGSVAAGTYVPPAVTKR